MRIKRGVTSRRRHKKVRALAKGFRGRNRTTIKTARQAVMKAGMHAYRDRRVKKRTFRSLWIVRLNAALRDMGTTYSKFIYAMTQKGVTLNRRALSELAVNDRPAFDALAKQILGEAAIVAKTPTGTKVGYTPKPKSTTPKAPVVKKPAAKKPAAKKPAAKKAPAKKK